MTRIESERGDVARGWGSEEGHRAAVTYSGQRSGQRVVPKAKRKRQKEKTMQKALPCGRLLGHS